MLISQRPSMNSAGPRISRTTFLKLMGAGAIVFVGSMFGLNNFMVQPDLRKRGNNAAAAGNGSWSRGIDTIDVGIHTALLNGGKVFYLAGSGFHVPQSKGPYTHAIWDPSTNTQQAQTLDEDLFCTGMATLADGDILLTGGTLLYDTDPDNLNGK